MTDKTVTIGSHMTLTGPPAAGYTEFAPAAKAYFDYVNTQGGVHGRKIIFAYRDDSYDSANTPEIVRQLVEHDKVFAVFGGFGTATHQTVVDYLNDQKIPDLFVTSGCPCWNEPVKHPYTFGVMTDYIREGKILGTYVRKAFPGKKIAFFYQDDDLGRSGVKGLDKVIPSSSVVARESYRPRYNDITPQVRAIDRAKPDVIVSFSSPTYTALLRRAQKNLDNAAQLVVSYAGSDPASLSPLLDDTAGNTQHPGGGNPLIQGIITDSYLPPVADTSNKWVALARMIHGRYLPGRPMNRYTYIGVTTAYLFVQALQQAGKNPTRESLITALEHGSFPGPGLTPLDYSPTSHSGYTGTQSASSKATPSSCKASP